MPVMCQKFSKIHNFPFSNNIMYNFLNKKKIKYAQEYTKQESTMSVEGFSSVKKLLDVQLMLIVGVTRCRDLEVYLPQNCHVHVFVVSFLVVLSHVFNLNSTITTKPTMLIYILSHLFLHSMKGSGAVFFACTDYQYLQIASKKKQLLTKVNVY